MTGPFQTMNFKHGFLRAGFSLGLLSLLAACHREPPPAVVAELPVATVSVATAGAGDRRATEEWVGTVRSKVRAALEAKVSGRIARMVAVPGQEVKAGQVLVEIDAQEIRARAEQAQAVLQQAEKERTRFATLLKQEAVTQSEFDAVEARFRVARSAVAEAETMLGYLTVTAPFDGVVTRKLAEAGDFASPGRPLVEVEDLRALRFEVDVPVTQAARVKLGDRPKVSVGAPAQELTAEVSEIDPAADPVSRTVRVKLELPAVAGLRAGSVGRLALETGEAALLSVPTNAVFARGQMELTFVVTNARAHLRLVRTGRSFGADREILAGLDPGEQVIIEGAAALVDGQRVQVR